MLPQSNLTLYPPDQNIYDDDDSEDDDDDDDDDDDSITAEPERLRSKPKLDLKP